MKLRLRITADQAPSFDWSYEGAEFVIGRDPNCELSFKSDGAQTVSWQHAKVTMTGPAPQVPDLASTNGVYVNGVKIEWPTTLRIGDEVRLGRQGPQIELLAMRAS